MISAALGQSDSDDLRDALREAAGYALKTAEIQSADAALVLLRRGGLGTAEESSWSDLGSELLAAASAHLGTPEVVAAVVDGAFGSGARRKSGGEIPRVAVYALAGVEAHSLGLHSSCAPEEAFEEELEASLGRSLDERDLVLLFAEPTRVNVRRLLAGIEADPKPPALAGIGAGDPLLGGGHVAVDVAALVIRASSPPRIEISQGCRPVSPRMRVTASEGHWIYEIDDRPALRSYREVARDPLSADLRRAAQRVVVGMPALPAGTGTSSPDEVANAFRNGQYAARSITGFDERRGAFAISEPLRPGTDIALLLRDGALARDELKRALDGCDAEAAFYLTCEGRGADLFGHDGLEEGYVDTALAPTPWVGMRGALQIAPLAGAPRLLQYAGVLALLEPKA